MVVKISKKDFEKSYSKVEEYEDHYDMLCDVEEYLVNYLDYSYDDISDNTDFEIKGNTIIVDVELD